MIPFSSSHVPANSRRCKWRLLQSDENLLTIIRQVRLAVSNGGHGGTDFREGQDISPELVSLFLFVLRRPDHHKQGGGMTGCLGYKSVWCWKAKEACEESGNAEQEKKS